MSQVGYSKREDRLLHKSTPGCSLWKRPPVWASLKLEGKHESCMSDLWYYWTDCQIAKIIHLLLTLKVETEIITAIILNSLVEPNNNWSKLLWHLAQRHRIHLTSQPLENKLLRPVSYYSFLFSLISKKATHILFNHSQLSNPLHLLEKLSEVPTVRWQSYLKGKNVKNQLN